MKGPTVAPGDNITKGGRSGDAEARGLADDRCVYEQQRQTHRWTAKRRPSEKRRSRGSTLLIQSLGAVCWINGVRDADWRLASRRPDGAISYKHIHTQYTYRDVHIYTREASGVVRHSNSQQFAYRQWRLGKRTRGRRENGRKSGLCAYVWLRYHIGRLDGSRRLIREFRTNELQQRPL